MAAYNKFQSFVEAVALKKHNLGADTLTIALTNALNPPVATNTVLANLVQIAYTNLSARVPTITSCVHTAGVLKLILADLVLTATGAVAPFRYVVLYNATALNGELIAWWDYGSEITLANGDTFTLDFDNVNGVLQLT